MLLKKINKVLKYIMIVIITLSILFLALAVSSMIPRSAIDKKMHESISFYEKNEGIRRIKNKRIYSYIHYFSDTRKLNIIYCLDSNKPIESMLWSKYYQEIKKDVNTDFINVVENNKEPNTQYLRYWNGCMLILRPLLTILNMEQIYLINKLILAMLLLILFIMLLKRSKKLAFIFMLALILVSSWYVPFCIEYSVTFYIMIITSIIAIKMDEEKNDDSLFKLFLITGIVTTFFDFLTTELLTIFIPLIIILVLRKERNRLDNSKATFIFFIKAVVLWFIGYCGMWFAKWILASIILKINAFDYVKDNFLLRINGLQGASSHKYLYGHVIERNFYAIPVLYYINTKFYKWYVKTSVIIIITFLLLFINWKELVKKRIIWILGLIGITPYIRYLVLANHSYRHAMFTFREQILTIIVALYIIVDCLNYKFLFKKVSFSNFLINKDKKYKKIRN